MGKLCKACNKFYNRNRPSGWWYNRRPNHAKLQYIDTSHFSLNISKEKTEVWKCPLCGFRYRVNRDLYEVMNLRPIRIKRRPRRKRKTRPVSI